VKGLRGLGGVGLPGERTVIGRLHGACLLLAHHFDHLGLLASQRDFVAENLVFDRVLEGCVQDDLHGLSLDEAHLDDALAESAVAQHLHDDALLAGMQFG